MDGECLFVFLSGGLCYHRDHLTNYISRWPLSPPKHLTSSPSRWNGAGVLVEQLRRLVLDIMECLFDFVPPGLQPGC